MLQRLEKAIDQHLLAPNGPTSAGVLSKYVALSTFFAIFIYGLERSDHPRKLDFDLTRHPVSVEKARKLYEKLETRLMNVNRDIRGQCEKNCQKEMKPCEILLQLEAMNGGIERGFWAQKAKEVREAKEVASAESLDEELRVLEDFDDRRSNALWKLGKKCKDDCRVGLKPCRIMHELEEMHQGVVTRWWPL